MQKLKGGDDPVVGVMEAVTYKLWREDDSPTLVWGHFLEFSGGRASLSRVLEGRLEGVAVYDGIVAVEKIA